MSEMEASVFFSDHEYYVFDNLIDKSLCNKMSDQILRIDDKYAYIETPQWYDKILQYNTSHIPGQSKYSRKYKAFYGDTVKDYATLVYDFYRSPETIQALEKTVGCSLHTIPTYKSSDISIQIYQNEGDGTNWHHDRSTYNGGRVFTFLVVTQNTSDQSFLVWTEKYGTETIPWTTGKCVVIEKFKTYHSVTPLHSGNRILLTLTYTEKPFYGSILQPYSYFMNRVKHMGHLGINALTIYDIIFLCLMTILIYIILLYGFSLLL